MDTRTLAIVAGVALVALLALFVLSTGARRDRAGAVGRLNRETKKADRPTTAVARRDDEDAQPVTGRELERAAALERRSAGREVAAAGPPPPPTYLDEDALGVTRRQFFNRGILGAFGLGLAGFGASSIAFLWPQLSGGFGSVINAGSLEDILGQIRDNREPFYVPEGRFYLNPYPQDAIPAARLAYSGGVLTGMEAGLVALYQKCVHLGCRVPWCTTSQWFECPCHGSQYNRVGERKAGPAPRGLDHFAVDVSGGRVSVDTKTVVQGPPLGTNTTGQEAEGPHCA